MLGPVCEMLTADLWGRRLTYHNINPSGFDFKRERDYTER